MTLYIGEREITPAIITQGSGGKQIEAVNNTGSNISEGDKVWINKSSNAYELVNYYSDIPNFNTIGSPIITNGVASGFNVNNYLQLPCPFNPGSNTWEIVFKVTTGSSFSNKPTIFGNYGASHQNAPQISILDNAHRFQWLIPYGSGSDFFTVVGSYTVQPNTTYWLKLSFTGSQYKLDYSTDGQTFITDSTYSSSDVIKPATTGFNIGFNYYGESSTEYWNGSIDLSESYIKVNNTDLWQPYITNITSDTQTGTAAENIAAGSTGLVNIGSSIDPIGSITITVNGTCNVTNYAEAIVNVPVPQPNIIVNSNISNEISLQNNSKYVCSNNNLYEYIYSNDLMFPLSVGNTFLFDTFMSNGSFYINANKLSNNPINEGGIWCSTAFYDGYDRIVFIDITVEDDNDIGWFMIHTGVDWNFNEVIWSLPNSSGNFIIPIFLNSTTNCFAFGIGNNEKSLKGDEIHINRIYEFILSVSPSE